MHGRRDLRQINSGTLGREEKDMMDFFLPMPTRTNRRTFLSAGSSLVALQAAQLTADDPFAPIKARLAGKDPIISVFAGDTDLTGLKGRT